MFNIVQRTHTIYYSCNSLQRFKNNNNGNAITNYLCRYIMEQAGYWNDLYGKLESNRNKLMEYLYEYEKIKSNHAGKSYVEIKRKIPMTKNWINKHEEKALVKIKLRPNTNIDIICIIRYSSPKGKSNYSAQWTVSFDAVFERIKYRDIREQSTAYQRSLMTASKRYDILTRDSYRCRICGRTAHDGVKLEVDHIIPVSKGGKTIDSNLQTLCFDCNQGKKAK